MFVLDRRVQLLVQKPGRSHLSLICFGPKRHYRVDGSCKHTDQIMAQIKPGAEVRIEPPSAAPGAKTKRAVG